MSKYLPEVYLPRNLTIGVQLLDELGAPLNFAAFNSIKFRIFSAHNLETIEKFSSKEESGFSELKKVNDYLYSAELDKNKTLKYIGHRVNSQIVVTDFDDNIISDELWTLKFVETENPIDYEKF